MPRPHEIVTRGRTRRSPRVTIGAVLGMFSACSLVLSTPALAGARRSSGRSGESQATAQPVKPGRLYRVTLMGRNGEHWFVVHVRGKRGGAHQGTGQGTIPAVALLRAIVVNHGRSCDSRATLLTANHARLGQGVVAGKSSLAVAGVALASGSYYLRLAAAGSTCARAGDAVSISDQSAKGALTLGPSGSGAGEAVYGGMPMASLSTFQYSCFAVTQKWDRLSIDLRRARSQAARRRLRAEIAAARRHAAQACG